MGRELVSSWHGLTWIIRNFRCGLAYVPNSRVRHYEGLMILDPYPTWKQFEHVNKGKGVAAWRIELQYLQDQAVARAQTLLQQATDDADVPQV